MTKGEMGLGNFFCLKKSKHFYCSLSISQPVLILSCVESNLNYVHLVVSYLHNVPNGWLCITGNSVAGQMSAVKTITS